MNSFIVEELIDRLFSSSNRYIHYGAARSLRELGDIRSLDALWHALEKYKNDLGLQHELILGICVLKDNRISEFLIEILKQEKSTLVATAIKGLGILKENRAVSHLVDLFMNCNQEEYSLMIPGGPTKLPGIHVKKIIIEALGNIETDDSVKELEKILHLDPKPFPEFQHFERLQCDVLLALARSNNQISNKIIAGSLSHPCRGVRRMARKHLNKSVDK